ncbi:acid protease [Suillus clintonianus]|uniref:acid protease n=1 Tax=Suillus clintonianus TaxID=1904413 RepID=UPI001B86B6F9|nr:acid protease [Suillus clintonianus]KAG2121621.1 acid protease [Suillus clintonianus]
MLPLTSLTIVLSLLVVGSPVSSIPLNTQKTVVSLVTKFKAGGVTNVVAGDRTRAHVLYRAAISGKHDANASITNVPPIGYTIQVGFGNPMKHYGLLVDTASGNTWIGADQEYTKTNTSTGTGNTVSVSYGSANFSGEEYLDTITLGSLSISNQSIGVANKYKGFEGVDGVLGIGPVNLTKGTVSNTDTVPTIMDNLFSQDSIDSEILGVYFVPVSEEDATGTLTFGGWNSSLMTSDITYVPITNTSPACTYWGINQSINYGDSNLLSSVSGIVDTATVLILIESDAFKTYQSATGATLDETTGLLKITPDQYSSLKPLIFTIGGTAFTLTPNAQIWPRSMNSVIGDTSGNSDNIYLIVADIGNKTTFGFVSGYTFLERFYSIFDTTNQRVGFATTAYTESTSN